MTWHVKMFATICGTERIGSFSVGPSPNMVVPNSFWHQSKKKLCIYSHHQATGILGIVHDEISGVLCSENTMRLGALCFGNTHPILTDTWEVRQQNWPINSDQFMYNPPIRKSNLKFHQNKNNIYLNYLKLPLQQTDINPLPYRYTTLCLACSPTSERPPRVSPRSWKIRLPRDPPGSCHGDQPWGSSQSNPHLVGGAMCPSWKIMEFVNGVGMTSH